MDALAIVTLISVVVGLVNFGCTLYVVYKLYQQNGIFHALFGFLCCQLYPYIWGWINGSRLKMYDIMIFWTFILILQVVIQVVVQFQVLSLSGEPPF